ncbi:hypothetical protein DH2020_021587 [Rehmannia glutinosa]|uniref:Uncharacterized protein n=1 Tax=Rehmannia glutinosa TaxID=99300 RepID=A0ABR0WAW6_REHGL
MPSGSNPDINATEANPAIGFNITPNTTISADLASLICQSYRQSIPVCLYANQAALNMVEITPDNLQMLTVDSILGGSNNFSLASVLPTLMQQVQNQPIINPPSMSRGGGISRLEMFDVDLGTGPESMRKETQKLMSARFRNNRARMHSFYKKHAHLPWDDRLKLMPEKLCDSQENWGYLCRLFETDEFKCIGRNRIHIYVALVKAKEAEDSQLALVHTKEHIDLIKSISSKDFKTMINCAKKFDSLYFNKGSSKAEALNQKCVAEMLFAVKDNWRGIFLSNLAKPINILAFKTKKNLTIDWRLGSYHDMVQLRDEIRESECQTDIHGMTNHLLDDIEIADRVCDQILGTSPGGYIHGLGNGPKFSSTFAEELVRTRIKLQTLESKLETMLQVFESVAPGVMKSFFQQHPSSSAPPPPTSNSES